MNNNKLYNFDEYLKESVTNIPNLFKQTLYRIPTDKELSEIEKYS